MEKSRELTFEQSLTDTPAALDPSVLTHSMTNIETEASLICNELMPSLPWRKLDFDPPSPPLCSSHPIGEGALLTMSRFSLLVYSTHTNRLISNRL